ncbi:MAG: phenylalanine--tRNA ligase subunit beta [Firmicutes bacterium]|nr:phenylalanine--tRNA ligase subunit beta [Bacillota bacterium]
MIVSLEWLKDYTDVNVSPETFCDRMIMSGSNLETMEIAGEDITNVVVGRIEKIERHPDADKLVVCYLNIGDKEAEGKDEETGLLQIVTGADNVFEGAYVPVALHNSHLPGPLHGQPKQEGGVTITSGKLRGVVSYGMLCSFGELGFDDKVVPVNQRDGIWILNLDRKNDAELAGKLGMGIVEAMELNDAVIDFEITPNRPDCLSMIGMAREAAATFNTKLKYPEMVCSKEEGQASDYVSVEVRNEACKRYIARIVKDVKIEDSPWWLQRRLIHAGMRPINNIVDITNFVMLEFGQPMHAFNIESLAGHKIIVDVAKDGEKFTTLDGTERTLDDRMLMINDAEKPVAIAGVMGGLNSEITPDTKTVVIESANFYSNSVRTTSKRLTLRTEASGRYEKGIDPNLAEAAADRMCYLIELIGAGTVVGGKVDVYPVPEEAKPVHARVSRINKVLGIELTREQMVGYLEALEMKVEGEGDDMYVTAPTVRQDIEIEEDIVEEVARLYGYDELPVTIPKGNNEASQTYSRDIRDIVRDSLCALGLDEIQTYSFVSPKSVDNVRIAEDSWERAFVKILNPLGEDTSVMRTILTPQMLEVLGRNYSRNLPKVKAFEIGNTFTANYVDETALPFEGYDLSIGMYGEGTDFFELKGIITELLNKLGIRDLKFVEETEYGVYHPGRCARIVARHVAELENGPLEEEVELGIMGEVHPKVTEKYGIGTKAYCAELTLESVMDLANMTKVFKPLAKYPSISRDIALLVDENITVGEIEETIKASATEILKDVKLFDIYRGVPIPPGKKSLAFSLTYRHDDRTLTDDDIMPVHNKVLKELESQLNAVLREM